MAVFLTKNAPGLRTSPVKRGNWVVKNILGERIPPPPPVVPELPRDEAKLGFATARDAGAASRRSELRRLPCAIRFARAWCLKDLGRSANAGERIWPAVRSMPRATFPGGSEGEGLEGLRQYIRDRPPERFRRQPLRQTAGLCAGPQPDAFR